MKSELAVSSLVINSLSYSEYSVANKIKGELGKGFSIYFPLNGHQKGVDFIVHKDRTGKIARIQVKSSSSYLKDKEEYSNSIWFTIKDFKKSYKPKIADFYIFFSEYYEKIYNGEKELLNESNDIKTTKFFLCYTDD